MTVFSFQTLAANYKYNELMIKDYDEMNSMVESFIQKSRDLAGDDEGHGNDAAAVEQLREAMKLIYSRPDSDNMVAKLTSEVRRELLSYSAFEDTVASVANEAINNAKNTNNSPSVQSTSLFILENVLSQIRPEIANNNNQVLKHVMEKIRDAHIKVSEDVFKDRKLRGMFKTNNPSDLAAEMLKKMSKEKKK
jgi:hypothetical protein